jgi:hypothetical protein
MKSKSPSWSYRKFISARAFRCLSINEHEDTGKGMVQLDQGDYEGSVRGDTVIRQGSHETHRIHPKGEKDRAS